jgi:hypothetical protein
MQKRPKYQKLQKNAKKTTFWVKKQVTSHTNSH